MRRPRSLYHLLAVTMTLILSCTQAFAVAQPAAGEGKLIDSIKQRGVMKVGMDTFQPWAMKDKNGKLIGFEIDVATRLANDMGVKVEFVPTAWSGIIPALLTGKFDVIIGGMSITDERRQKVDFTDPYDFSGMSIVASKKLAAGFTSLEDFNKSDVQIAVKLGTTAVSAAKKFIPNATLRMFDSEPQTYQELRNGNVHAVVGSEPRPAYEAVDYPDTVFMPLAETFTKEPIGFALRQGDQQSLAFFNGWIAKVGAEGWLKERHNYWFGTKDWQNQVE